MEGQYNLFSIDHIIKQNMTLYFYGTYEGDNGFQLAIKKRKLAFHYSFPVEWISETTWRTKVDFHYTDFSKGDWDYYIIENGERTQRVTVGNDISLEETKPLYCSSEKGSKEIAHYNTKNNNLSFTSKSKPIHLLDLQSKRGNSWNVLLNATIAKGPIQHSISYRKPYITLHERNTGKMTHISCEVREGNEQDCFSFKVDYMNLLTDYHTNKSWDVFLNIDIDGVYQTFRLALNSNQIAYDSRIQINDDYLHQMYFYQTINSRMALCFTEIHLKQNIDKYDLRSKTLFLKGNAYFDAISLSDKEKIKRSVIIRAHQSDREFFFPLKDASVSEKDFQVKIPLKHISSYHINYEIYDIYIQFKYKQITKRCKLGCNDYVYYKDGVLSSAQFTKKLQKFFVKYYLTYTPAGNLKLETFLLTN